MKDLGHLWIRLMGMLAFLLALACGGAAKYDVAAPEAPGYPNAPMAYEAPTAEAATDARDFMGSGDGKKKMAEAVAPAPPSVAQPNDQPSEAPRVANDAVQIQQILIYTANLQLAVFEVKKSLDEIEALAKGLGGFLSNRSNDSITIRVPSKRFDDALVAIAKSGDVLSRNVSTEDVTDEFLDVTLRLKNARDVRERIAKLLGDAKSVEDALRVEAELKRLSEEIERMEGRLKYLRDRAQFSTITVAFTPKTTSDVQTKRIQLPFPWLDALGLGRLINLR